jgi:hypothetical protein
MTGPLRVGQLRPSQLLYTFGVGAAVDLPNLSAMVLGLDQWDPTRSQILAEDRLLAAVRGRLGTEVKELRLPPWMPETADVNGDWAGVGVPVAPFPRWLRCPRCSYLSSIETGLFVLKDNPWRPDETRYEHQNCSKGRAPTALPVRFLLACPRGHLDEFPWIEYVHKGEPCEKKAPFLNLFERGVTGRAAEIVVECKACGARRNLAQAMEREVPVMPKCRGRHPHLGVREDCENQTEVILLGASNAWFPITLSVVAIPRAMSSVEQLVAKHWNVLSKVTGSESLAFARQAFPELAALSEAPDEDVLAAIKQQHESEEAVADANVDLKGPEWEVLSSPSKAPVGDDFRLREVAVPRRFADTVSRVVLAERLRQVVALVGFTRVEPPDEVDASDPLTSQAPLARKSTSWVPAAESKGEGIFIQLDEEAVAAWETKVKDSAQMAQLEKGNGAWCGARGIDPSVRWPGARFVLLHTLSHLLMREMALESGYASASVRERLYARGGADPMAGLLLYTAASDSEGTLGGLVGLGKPETLEPLLAQALRHAGLCSSDPMCAEHDPAEDTSLHGAGCHACLFASETSCERGNGYLDRTLVVPTLVTSALAFFGHDE